MTVGIIFICLLGGVVIWMLFLSKPEKNSAQEENLRDELLFDPLTGKKISMEEAEHGVVLENYAGPRIKPDQEIEENYSDDQKEIEYILRDFIKSGVDEIAGEDDDEVSFDQILAQSEYAKGLDTIEIHHLWKFRPKFFFGLAYVSYSHIGRNQGHEYQAFAIMANQSGISAFTTIEEVYVELIDDAVLVRLPIKITHAAFRKFVEDVNDRMQGGS